ncbi:MAG TPA: molybdopterin-dependent oxidoreductase [Acidimicrobiales bacterium]|nr:molybdopterin-dependent oxidoreductase [Acidimicrobiales bacterium]
MQRSTTSRAGNERRLAGAPIGRRVVIGMLGLGAVGIVGGKRIQDGLNSILNPIQRVDPTGLTGLLPGAYFRIYTVTDGFPSADPATYRLRVDGLVANPYDISIPELQALPPTRLVRDFQCVTGWRVPGVHWEGVALSTLLDKAGVQPNGKALRLESFDGTYSESLTLSEAYRPDVIVAYSMLGGPVSREHGGPVRLYVAPMYGYKSIKWLSRVEVVDQVEPGYWETVGNYDVEAWVGHSNGRNDPST